MLLSNALSAKKQLSSFSLSTHNLFAKRGAQQEPLSKPRHQLLEVSISSSGLGVFPSMESTKVSKRTNICRTKRVSTKSHRFTGTTRSKVFPFKLIYETELSFHIGCERNTAVFLDLWMAQLWRCSRLGWTRP